MSDWFEYVSGPFVAHPNVFCAWCGRPKGYNPNLTGPSHGICSLCRNKVVWRFRAQYIWSRKEWAYQTGKSYLLQAKTAILKELPYPLSLLPKSE